MLQLFLNQIHFKLLWLLEEFKLFYTKLNVIIQQII